MAFSKIFLSISCTVANLIVFNVRKKEEEGSSFSPLLPKELNGTIDEPVRGESDRARERPETKVVPLLSSSEVLSTVNYQLT